MSKVLKFCANCKYWYCYDDKSKCVDYVSEGQCHRYPPNVPVFDNAKDSLWNVNQLVLCLTKGVVLTDHPFTFAEDWCGEFKPMKNPRWVDDERCNE